MRTRQFFLLLTTSRIWLMFKVQPKLPENFEDNTWEKLQKAVSAVQGKRPIATSREELYRAVEDLCVHKMGARLYDR